MYLKLSFCRSACFHGEVFKYSEERGEIDSASVRSTMYRAPLQTQGAHGEQDVEQSLLSRSLNSSKEKQTLKF